jgi:hypothetical protein
MMHSPHQPCWIGAGISNLHEARVLEMTARHVKVHLNEVTSIPEECNLFFTPDFREGRKCFVIEQNGAEVVLAFREGFGVPTTAKPPKSRP